MIFFCWRVAISIWSRGPKVFQFTLVAVYQAATFIFWVGRCTRLAHIPSRPLVLSPSRSIWSLSLSMLAVSLATANPLLDPIARLDTVVATSLEQLLSRPLEFVEGSSSGILAVPEGRYRPINAARQDGPDSPMKVGFPSGSTVSLFFDKFWFSLLLIQSLRMKTFKTRSRGRYTNMLSLFITLTTLITSGPGCLTSAIHVF
jgi:hypothetical protein